MRKLTLFLFVITIQSISWGQVQINHLDISEFSHGFHITTSKPVDKQNILGNITIPSFNQTNNTPIWRIAQWGTNYPLLPGVFQKKDDATWYIENEAKKIILKKEDRYWSIQLNCNGIKEYQGRLRQYGEPWAHLLIEKVFTEEIKIKKYELHFEIDFRITRCECDPSLKDRIDSSLHTAQITAYWTVKNSNPASPDYKEYFWFGIPLFDVRYPIPPEFINRDSGSVYTTNKMIAVVDGKQFYATDTGDGAKKSLNILLNPYIEKYLRKGQEQGFLKNSKMDDLTLTSFNLGWEVTGPYDAEIEISHLAMPCVLKN